MGLSPRQAPHLLTADEVDGTEANGGVKSLLVSGTGLLEDGGRVEGHDCGCKERAPLVSNVPSVKATQIFAHC